MEQETVNPDDGVLFARDMRRIREFRELSFEQVSADTRIPADILQAFETNTLFGHSAFNRVYLRSIVRGYAAAIRIPENEAIDGLEQALIGMYRGDLAQKYAPGQDEDAVEKSTSSPASETGSPETPDSPSPEPASTDASSDSVATTSADAPSGTSIDATRDTSPDRQRDASGDTTTGESAGATAGRAGDAASDPADTADRSAASGADPSERRVRRIRAADKGRGHSKSDAPPVAISTAPTPSEIAHVAGQSDGGSGVVVRPTLVRNVILVALLVVAIIAVVWYAVSRPSGGDAGQSTAPVQLDQPAAAADVATTQEEQRLPATPDVRPAGAIVAELPDSIQVDIRSLGRPVREIRIRMDRGLRRPYWIERDSTITLRFADRIIVENHGGLVEVSVPAAGFRSGGMAPGIPFILRRRDLRPVGPDS